MSKTIKIHTGSLNTNNGLVVEWAPIALAIVPTIPKPNHWKGKLNSGLSLEYQTCSIFQPLMYLFASLWVFPYPWGSNDHPCPVNELDIIFIFQSPRNGSISNSFLAGLKLFKKTKASWHHWNLNKRVIYQTLTSRGDDSRLVKLDKVESQPSRTRVTSWITSC